jgi:predicted hydrocarbon binding protein
LEYTQVALPAIRSFGLPGKKVSMKRNEFMKGCAAGMCSCAAMAFLPSEAAAAQSANPEIEQLKGKVDACQVRFAKLVGILNQTLDPRARKQVFQSLGRECAKQYGDLTGKYKNNIKGFLETAQQQWVEKAEYDEKRGTIRIVDKGPNCSCPLVKKGLTPPEFCDCTLGWQKEAYAAILGRPVDAELEESILRGGSRCIFRIRVV